MTSDLCFFLGGFDKSSYLSSSFDLETGGSLLSWRLDLLRSLLSGPRSPSFGLSLSILTQY